MTLAIPFWTQVALSAIDKLVLGGVLGALGYLASLRLENYRSRQGLRTEIAKKRVDIIATVWQAIAEYENHCFQQVYTIAAAVHHRLKELKIAPLDEELDPNIENALAQLSKYGEQDLPDQAVEQLQQTMLPATNRLLAQGEELKKVLILNRFWLGDRLYRDLRGYCSDLVEAFAALTPAYADRVAFRRAYQELVKRRDDAATILNKVLGK